MATGESVFERTELTASVRDGGNVEPFIVAPLRRGALLQARDVRPGPVLPLDSRLAVLGILTERDRLLVVARDQVGRVSRARQGKEGWREWTRRDAWNECLVEFFLALARKIVEKKKKLTGQSRGICPSLRSLYTALMGQSIPQETREGRPGGRRGARARVRSAFQRWTDSRAKGVGKTNLDVVIAIEFDRLSLSNELDM